jgi:hypothetical protein
MISGATQLHDALRWEKTRWTDETCEASIAGCADIVSAPILAELVSELHSCTSIVSTFPRSASATRRSCASCFDSTSRADGPSEFSVPRHT